MKKTIYTIAILFLVVLTFFSACKDDCDDPTDSDCENYDPCYNKKPACADFGIYEVVGEFKTTYLSETDTILGINGVAFKPKAKHEQKITWLLGTEVLTQEELFRTNFPLGRNIKVTMVAEVPLSNCTSETQQRDTVSKSFYVVECCIDSNTKKKTPWWGTWVGADTDLPLDTFSISWGWIDVYGSSYFGFTGLPKGIPVQRPFYSLSSSKTSGTFVYVGYRASLFVDDGNHQAWDGFALNGVATREGNEITIDYKYNDLPYQSWLIGEKEVVEPIRWVSKQWKGKRISKTVRTK